MEATEQKRARVMELLDEKYIERADISESLKQRLLKMSKISTEKVRIDKKGIVNYIWSRENMVIERKVIPFCEPILHIKSTDEFFILDKPAYYEGKYPVWFVERGNPVSLLFERASGACMDNGVVREIPRTSSEIKAIISSMYWQLSFRRTKLSPAQYLYIIVLIICCCLVEGIAFILYNQSKGWV